MTGEPVSGLGKPCGYALFLRLLCLVPEACFSRYSMFLASLSSWGLHCNLGFTLKALCIDYSGTPYRESAAAPCNLYSQAFLRTLVLAFMTSPLFHSAYLQNQHQEDHAVLVILLLL